VLYKRLIALKNSIYNLHILDRDYIYIDNICIAGCTLWSKPEIQIPKYIVRICGVTTQLYENWFKSDLHFLKGAISRCKQNKTPLIVITHHCPSFKTLKGSNKREKFVSLYASELEYLLNKENVHTWICGHVHKNFDFVTNEGTRVVSNQKGKLKDNCFDYSKQFVIDIE
jgi:predicted phosphohydrolase